jgi:hypothetical protein
VKSTSTDVGQVYRWIRPWTEIPTNFDICILQRKCMFTYLAEDTYRRMRLLQLSIHLNLSAAAAVIGQTLVM